MICKPYQATLGLFHLIACYYVLALEQLVCAIILIFFLMMVVTDTGYCYRA